MLLIDFLAMILLYTVYTVIKPLSKEDSMGEVLFIFLAGFGFLFLTIDTIDKIKGLF
jgi:hypothetical protein